VSILLLVPVAAMVRFSANWRSRLVAFAGVAGLAASAAVTELYVFRAMGVGAYFPVVATGFGLMGIWIGGLGFIGGRSKHLPRGMDRLGVAVGAGLVAIPAGVFLLGGLDMMTAPKLVLNKCPATATFVIGTVATVIGLPIWSSWLGRCLLKGGSWSATNQPERVPIGDADGDAEQGRHR
jgi:hypothetical protein